MKDKIIEGFEIVSSVDRRILDQGDCALLYIPFTDIEAKIFAPEIIDPCMRIKFIKKEILAQENECLFGHEFGRDWEEFAECNQQCSVARANCGRLWSSNNDGACAKVVQKEKCPHNLTFGKDNRTHLLCNHCDVSHECWKRWKLYWSGHPVMHHPV